MTRREIVIEAATRQLRDSFRMTEHEVEYYFGDNMIAAFNVESLGEQLADAILAALDDAEYECVQKLDAKTVRRKYHVFEHHSNCIYCGISRADYERKRGENDTR